MAGIIGAGVTLGNFGTKLMINYTKSQYDEKVQELQSYAQKLNTHLNNLEGYKNQIRNYWSDEEAEKYQSALNMQIKAIKNALNRVDSLKGIYERTSQELSEQKSKSSAALDEAKQLIDELGIGDD